MNKKTLKAICSITFILSSMFLINCFGGIPTMPMGEIQNKAILLADLLPGKFGKLWVERTIQLKATFEGSQNSSGMAGGPGGGGFFPLTAQATFIDSSLIECGLNEFENLSNMEEKEISEYEKLYKETYKTDNNYFIWLELQTPYTEEIIDLNRLDIFWEDDKGNKYEPSQVIEYSVEKNRNPFYNFNLVDRDSIGKELQRWEVTKKNFIILFSKTDVIGEKVIDENTKTLTIVLFDWNDKGLKHKGTWSL
jgi:hypothetical protein